MLSHSYFAHTTFIQKKGARNVQINTVTVLLGSYPLSQGIFPGKCVMKLFKERNYHSGVNNWGLLCLYPNTKDTELGFLCLPMIFVVSTPE
jgi:hypothetical protein